MTTANPPRRSQQQAEPRPLPGSWEGTLEQARRHSGNGNPQAIELFQKVINGLTRLPEARRRAAGNKLQDLYMQALVGLQSFYAARDRFDEAVAVLESARPNVANDELEYISDQVISLQFMAGHNEAAIQALRTEAEASSTAITDWNRVVWGFIRSARPAEVLPLLDELEQRFSVTGVQAGIESADASSDDEHVATPTEDEDKDEDADGDEADRDPAYIRACIEGLRAVALLEMDAFDAGIAAFERALEHPESPYRQSLHLLYSRLSNAGRLEDALRFIQRDARYPVRAGFWRGLTYLRQGRAGDAKAAWRALSDLSQDDLKRAPVEFTMARFYLDDPGGETLTGLLGALRQTENPSWTLLMLAGLGFAVRGDRDTATTDFRLALSICKSLGEGRRLPEGLWHMVKELFKRDDVQFYSQFFELPLPKPARPDGEAA